MPKNSPQKKPAGTARKSAKVENSFVIAQYFGFNGFQLPEISRDNKKKVANVRKSSGFVHTLLPPIEEPAAILSHLHEKLQKRSASDPLMFYYAGKTAPVAKAKSGERVLNLHVIGTPKSIGDVILIKTALAILEEDGYKDVSVEINHVGGKEAMGRFFRELNAYYRKHLTEMNGHCRQLFKDSAHSLILCKEELDAELLENAPSPLNFLTDINRNHFKEVIEYLDNQSIPYEVNKNVLGDPHYSSHTVFSIVDKKTGRILATGTRYNQLAKKIGFRKEVPGASVTIRVTSSKKVPSTRMPKKEKIRFFFMQIGTDAKMKSLAVIDVLRRAGIPVHQSLSRDRLSTQLQYAQRLHVPYLLIMGQKEALENSVVVRDTNTHKQTTVPVSRLAEYLKGLK